MPWDEASKILFGYGPLGVFALVCCVVVGWLGRAIFYALFSEAEGKDGNPKGIARWLATKHIEAVEQMVTTQQTMVASQTTNQELTRTLVATVREALVAGEAAAADSGKILIIAGDTFRLAKESFAILTCYLMAVQRRVQFQDAKRIFVLLVEDNQVDARIIHGVLKSALGELSWMHVTSLADAQRLLEATRLVILDVQLPDSTIKESLNLFIALAVGAGAVVIIHSGGEWTRADFPAAFDVITKGDNDGLRRAVTELLSMKA